MGFLDKLGTIAGGIVGFLVGGPVGAVIGAGIGSIPAVNKVVNKALDFVMKPFMKLFGVPDLPDVSAEAAKQEGYLVTRDGSNQNIPVIYGFRQTGGTVTFMETGGENGTIKNRYLWIGYALCEGPVEGLKTLAIDDRDFPESIVARLNTGETVDITGLDTATQPASKYNGVTKLKFWHGTWYDDAANSPLPAQLKENIFKDCPNTDGNLDSAFYNGCCALFARYEIIERTTEEAQNNNPFGGGIPQIQAGIMGRKVVALATNVYTNGTLNSGATSTMTTNINTWWVVNSVVEAAFNGNSYDQNAGRYSTNPAECMFDYMRNPRYGKGLRLKDIDKTSWQNAANKCNQLVTYYTGAVGPILTCNYIVSTDQTLMTNTKNLLAGFRAYMPYIQGKYKIVIDDAGNSTDILSGVASIVQTITRDEITGEVTYSGIERTSKYNHVVVRFVDPLQKWSTQEVVWPQTEAERQTYIAEDGGLENKGEFTAFTITNPIMALDYARLIFNKSRYQESCHFSMSAQGFELEPGDNVYIQSNILNFGTIPWRVVATTLNTNYTFDVQCVRNPDNIYPYGRYNEPDIVRSPYIPRQNEVYLPGVTLPRMDIFPPSYAPLPAGWTGTLPPGTPTPTTPTNTGTTTNPGGGGIGGGGGGVIDGGTTVTNPPAPTPATPVVRTDHIIVFTGSTFNSASNSYTVTFSVPDGIQYGGVKIWWRPASISSYFELPDLSSGARDFSFQSPTSFAQQHYVVARLKYSNGEYSTNRNKATLYGAASGISGQGIDNSELVVQDPTVINQNAAIEMVSMNVVTPLTTPRSMTLKVKEPIVRDQLPNRNISNVLFYYRNNSMPANTWYLYDKYTPPTGYLGNAEFTIPLNNLFDANYTDWSIVIRWRFTNGQLGNYVYKQNIRTDVDNIGIVGGYTNVIPTLTLAPDPAITNNTASLTSLGAIIGGGTDKMYIHFLNPSASPISMVNWAGIRIDYAIATPGSTLTYKTLTFPTTQCYTSGVVNGWYVQITDTNFSANRDYHIIATLAYTSGGSTVYSTRAIKYTGGFFAGKTGDQIGVTGGLQLAGAPTDYLTLKSEYSATPIPGQPSDKQIVAVTKVEGYLTTNPAVGAVDQTFGVPHFRITVSIPTGITVNKVRVYRRFNSGTNVGKMEYSDYTTLSQGSPQAVFRLGRNNLNPTSVNSGIVDQYAYQVTPAFSWQDVYVRLYTDAGTASKAVVRVLNNGNPTTYSSWTDITPITYNSTNNIIDLDIDTNLNTLLNGAIQADANIEPYNLIAGTVNAGGCRIKWQIPNITFGGPTESSGFRK